MESKEKKEFCEMMTLATAYVYHKALGLDFVIGNGEVTEVQAAGKPLHENQNRRART